MVKNDNVMEIFYKQTCMLINEIWNDNEYQRAIYKEVQHYFIVAEIILIAQLIIISKVLETVFWIFFYLTTRFIH